MQGAAEEPTDPAATLKVTDWAAIDANGSYTFEINYMGQNKMIVDEDPDTGETTVTFTGPSGVGGTETDPKLPKYNPQGELYIYTLKELKIDWPEREGTGASQSPDWEKIFESAGIGNTYQIQNTYRDGDGRLSFKKFMYLPMNDEGNPEAYPGVRFKLTRTYTKNDGNRSEAELVEYIVWSSSEVMEAYKDLEEGAQKEGGLVEKTFTVDGLELYAPNGSPYVYQVTEIRENLQGYETWVADREVTVDNIGDIVGNGVQEPQGTHYEADGSEVSSGGIGAAEDENPPVSVTFINRRAEKQDTITLTGSKSWEDYGDVFDFRPEDITLTLSRRANAQPGQGNEIAKELVPETDYQINWDKDSEEDTWTYTITGKENSGELERNAPNGTPWIYTVKEEYTGDEYDVTPAGGEATVTAPSTGDGKMPELKNSLMTSASFKKEWRDAEGEPITEDYLGYDLTVEFQLQVAQAAINESGTVTKVEKWEDASDAYFKNLIGEDAYSKIFGADSAYQFSGELTGRIDADTWKTGCTFKNLPRVVKIDDKTIHLIYRVVETEIRFGNTVTTVTVNDSENNRTYTYEFTPETWFTPDYEKDASNSADTKIHINKLKTTGFTITKNWEGDGGNSYGTRPSTDRDGEDWEVCFVIQRTTTPDEADSWENLTTPEGTAWIERLTGTNAQGSVTLEVKGLPPADEDGKSYSYRAMELKPKEGSYADGKVEDEDIVPDGGEFHTAYTADYGEAGSGAGSGADSGSGNTAVTNTMATTRVYAEKLWRGDEKADKVTLELQYLGEDGKWKSFATPARVALDGETDTDTEERSWYEYEAWKAVWENVPVAMPGSKLENGATQYRAAETAPSGYIQVDSDEGIKTDNGTSYPEYTFTNTKAVSLEVTKDWRVTDEAVKKAVAVELWRTIGKIDEAGKAEQVKDKNGAVMTKVLDASSGWKAEFTALPKYNEAGEPYRYYAKEVSIDGDADALSDFRILYEHTGEAGDDSFTTAVTNIELMDLVGTKIWKDNGNAYLTRPESIELILERSTQANPDPKKDQGWTEVDADTLKAEGAKLTWTKGSGGVWRWKYTDLRSHTDDGEACTYRVREKEPEIPEDAAAGLNDSYQGTQVGNVITNTLTGTTKVTVTKKWVDLNDQRGGRPDSVTIVLLADGAECKRAEISAGNIFSRLAKALGGQEDDTWAYTFENLPKYDEDGKRIEYTVKEEETEGYETSYDGYLITNTSENGALSLEKTVTGSGAEKGRYFTFTLVLKDAVGNALAGEYEYTGSGKGTLRSGDALRLKHGQKITIWGLPAGTRYVITESGSDGYEVTASGASGTVEGGKVSEAAFENHRDNPDSQGGSGGGSSSGSSPSKTGSVRTGDSSRPWLWAVLALLAAAGLAGIAAYMTKRKTGNIKKHSDEKKNR